MGPVSGPLVQESHRVGHTIRIGSEWLEREGPKELLCPPALSPRWGILCRRKGWLLGDLQWPANFRALLC